MKPKKKKKKNKQEQVDEEEVSKTKEEESGESSTKKKKKKRKNEDVDDDQSEKKKLLNSVSGVLFRPGERRISPPQDKKKAFIRRPKDVFTAIITPIELRIRRPNFGNSPQPFWLSPTKQKQSKTPALLYFVTDFNFKRNFISTLMFVKLQ